VSETAQNGKGSSRRPTDAAKYNDNFDRIFCKKGNVPQHTTTEIETVQLLDTYSEGHAWRPACGGMERPFEWADKEYLYMYNHETGEHAYYNATDDVFENSVEFN
jgi:hypothetical protein